MTQRTVPAQLPEAYPAPVAAVIMDLSEEIVEIWNRQVDGEAWTAVSTELPIYLSEVRRQYDIDVDHDDDIARAMLRRSRSGGTAPAQSFALSAVTLAIMAATRARIPEWLEPLTDLEELIDVDRQEEAERRLVEAAYQQWMIKAGVYDEQH